MKVDLLKLTRLNRIAVCGRCKHQFDVSVQLTTISDDTPSVRPEPEGEPMRLTPSHIPMVDTPTPVPGYDTVPPTSGPYRESDSPAPPPISAANRETKPGSGRAKAGSKDHGAAPKDSIWPAASRPRLGWSKRPGKEDRDTDPSMPRAEHDTEPSSMPFGLELELDAPRPLARKGGKKRKKKDSLVRQRGKEIVVEVGDRKNKKKRRRNTYDPESLITNPDLVAPRVEGDDEG